MRWDRRREERLDDASIDEELRYLLDERVRPEPPAPVLEHEQDGDPADPERRPVETGGRG